MEERHCKHLGMILFSIRQYDPYEVVNQAQYLVQYITWSNAEVNSKYGTPQARGQCAGQPEGLPPLGKQRIDQHAKEEMCSSVALTLSRKSA